MATYQGKHTGKGAVKYAARAILAERRETPKTFFGKARKGISEAFRGTKKFVQTRGPGINRGLGRVAESIQSGFETPRRMPQRFRHSPMRRMTMRPMRQPRMMRSRINWNNLGVNF